MLSYYILIRLNLIWQQILRVLKHLVWIKAIFILYISSFYDYLIFILAIFIRKVDKISPKTLQSSKYFGTVTKVRFQSAHKQSFRYVKHFI